MTKKNVCRIIFTFWCWERSPIGSWCSWSAPASQALVQRPSRAGRSSPRRQPCRWRDGWPPWSATEGRMCPARSCRGASEPRGGKAFEAPATLGFMVVFLFVSPFQFQSHSFLFKTESNLNRLRVALGRTAPIVASQLQVESADKLK